MLQGGKDRVGEGAEWLGEVSRACRVVERRCV